MNKILIYETGRPAVSVLACEAAATLPSTGGAGQIMLHVEQSRARPHNWSIRSGRCDVKRKFGENLTHNNFLYDLKSTLIFGQHYKSN